MLLTLTLLSALQAAPVADSIPGTWTITGDIAGMPLNEVCTLSQSGTAIAGSCRIEGMEATPVTGEVKEGRVTFQHGGSYEGQPLTIIYSGTLTSPSELKGTITVQPFDVGGEFTAKSAPAAP